MTNDKLSQSQIILKVLESSSEPVPSHAIQKTQTSWGWLGTSADREARRLAEEGKISRERVGKYTYYSKHKYDNSIDWGIYGN